MNQEPSTSYKYYVLAMLTLVYTFNFVDRQILSVLQEPMKAELGLNDTQLGLLQGLTFALFYVTLGIPIARWADVGNRRNIVAMALGLWSFMTSITGLAQNFIQLLLIRIGVGVGEAGGSPPSHSIISDLFKPSERGRALAIYSSGITFGVFLAYVFGGWVSDSFGWRSVFIALGIPGIVLAFIVWLSIKEPKRGLYEQQASIDAPPPMMDVVHLLFSRKSFLHLAFGAALVAFVGYGVAAFLVSFFVRSHGISVSNLSEITLPLGIIIGVGGLIGNFGGGYFSDKLGEKDKRWYLWVPAIATVFSVPFAYATFLIDNTTVAVALYIVPLALSYAFLGPNLAIAHALVSPRMRALTSAIFLFITNLVGLGLGPTVVGILSDTLSANYGMESLRYAILICLIVYFWAAFHFYLSAKTVREDLNNVCIKLTPEDKQNSLLHKLLAPLGLSKV